MIKPFVAGFLGGLLGALLGAALTPVQVEFGNTEMEEVTL